MSELIDNTAGLIDGDAGLIPETNDVEDTTNKRKKRSRERGKDSKPRKYPLHTMKNLPQFRDKPHEEVRQYILKTKGVDIGNNFNCNKTIMWILIGFLVVTCGIGIVKWWQNKQERKINGSITKADSVNYG